MPDVPGLYRRLGVNLPAFGDGWASTRCFTGRHQDRHPSARVHLRSGGFRCFACNSAGGVLDALQLLGLDRDEARRLAVEYGILGETRRRQRQAPPGVRPTPEPVESVGVAEIGGRVDYDTLAAGPAVVRERAWSYVDANNVPVGRVRRLDLAGGGKTIWQERRDGNDWATGLAGAQLPLYRLPEVLDRARRGLRVLIVEGEKACDALDLIGLFATTNAGGAGKWRHEHTNALHGATVLAICDCDLAGRLHAIRVTLELLAAGVHVLSPLDPDPGRNDGYDVVDDLADLAATIRAVTPEISDAVVRGRLHDHLQGRIGEQLRADSGELQRRLEFAHFTADPEGRRYLDCPRCGRERVHKLAAGIAYCPCGAHQAAPT